MKSFSTILISLTFAGTALAHGIVTKITIDGKDYKGNVPNGPKTPSIIRLISDPSPVKGANNPAINCGPDAGPAELVADAMPGSSIKFDWTGADFQPWPHNTGPMFTFMASCGAQSCDKFDSGEAKWFKIEQTGRKQTGGEWVQADLMKGATADVTLPKNLAPGNYLIRHEILALHLAETKGGAEFYPSCAQIRVGGSQTGKPAASDLVSFPGAYNDNDPGIFDKDVFNAKASYTFPGPKVASFISGDDDDNTPAPPKPTTTKSSGNPKPAQTQASGGNCKLKKKISSSSSANVTAATVRPRHLSRVMRGRGLIAGHSARPLA